MSGTSVEGRDASGGDGFASYILALILAFDVLIAAILALGSRSVADGLDPDWAGFARDFRVWCFRGDPGTGRLDWFFPFSLFSESLLLVGIVYSIWGGGLLRYWRSKPLAAAKPAAAAAATMALAAVALVYTGAEARKAGPREFPGASLRTAIPAPAATLTDQEGRAVSIPDPGGRILILTSFYAHCVSTCPAIFLQLASVRDSLSSLERSQIAFVAVTLDPARDTPEGLKEMAAARKLDPGSMRLATGDPAAVDSLLDRLGMGRRIDPATGNIEHAGLILVCDRAGRIAYRFTLGETQRAWTLAAIRGLIAEPPVRAVLEGP
jgi:cytochrome oxidase Cu insertion factor (SCO1/SenC/PrrC family)